MTAVSEGRKLRPISSEACAGRTTGQGVVGQLRVVLGRRRLRPGAEPAVQRFLPGDEVAWKVVASSRHRIEDVVIRPVGYARGDTDLGMLTGKELSEES